MSARFDLKRDAIGWTVFDRWTGMAVVIDLLPQTGLGFADAEDLVRRLNLQSGRDDRTILQ